MSEKQHEMEQIALKTINVDKGIKRLVIWLNGFSSVQTVWSCQGADSKEKLEGIKNTPQGEDIPCTGSWSPYVVFVCDNLDHLTIIAECIQRFSLLDRAEKGFMIFEIDYDTEMKRLRYEIHFNGVNTSDALVDFYEKVYKSELQEKLEQIP